METNKDYRLCGGIFFSLLLQARGQRTAARQHRQGNTDSFKEKDILTELIRIAYPSFIEPAGNSMSTYSSNYKTCKFSSNEFIPFEDEDLINGFEQAIRNDYESSMIAMSSFIDSYINVSLKGGWVVAALLELIANDPSIMDSDTFYIDADGQPVSKEQMLKLHDISLQPFLLGIWHFIVTQRPDNKIGRQTFEMLHSKSGSGNSGWNFTSDIGKKPNRAINIDILEINTINGNVGFPKNDDSDPYEDGISRFMPDIAPELTGEPLYILTQEAVGLCSESEFSEYFDSVTQKYNRVKTLLYNDIPKPFYDFYICNDIWHRIPVSKRTYQTKTIHNATADLLAECSNFVLITGTGGLGKSMMMRHLLLDSVKRFDEIRLVPIFLPLKDYTSEYSDLTDFVYETFGSLGGGKTADEFTDMLVEGSCLLLFDGLDEINSEYRQKFERHLELFADKYSQNMFVISSRPSGSFIAFSRFTVLHLNEFTKAQALELIDRLDFRPDEPAIKGNFRRELENSLYYTHKEFTTNPLLLTIMLMTYEQFAEVPSKMHIFYREAYITLSQKHDANKGGYKRPLKTGVTADRFADYLAEFCARTYRDEKYEFMEIEFDKYFTQMNEPKKDGNNADASDFRHDLVNNLCLMYYESNRYHFTHRSFQEYFCALYFSKQKDKFLQKIGDFFETKRFRNYGDKTFHMLYDMISEKVEEYIFEPFLASLFNKCDENNGYWTFLETMYPALYYEEGETNEFSSNEPESFLYNFIIHAKSLYEILGNDDLPHDEEFITHEWVYLDEHWRDEDGEVIDGLVEADEVPREYEEYFGTPDIVGRNFELKIEHILSYPDEYSDIISQLESRGFPLMDEFINAREYWQELVDKKQPAGDDLFDLFQ